MAGLPPPVQQPVVEISSDFDREERVWSTTLTGDKKIIDKAWLGFERQLLWQQPKRLQEIGKCSVCSL